jgi:hypothetical protein
MVLYERVYILNRQEASSSETSKTIHESVSRRNPDNFNEILRFNVAYKNREYNTIQYNSISMKQREYFGVCIGQNGRRKRKGVLQILKLKFCKQSTL